MTAQPAASAAASPLGESSSATHRGGRRAEQRGGPQVRLRVGLAPWSRRPRTRSRGTARRVAASTASMICRSEEVTRACGIPAASTSASSSPRRASAARPASRTSSAMPSTSHRATTSWAAGACRLALADTRSCGAATPPIRCFLVGLAPRAAQPGHDGRLDLEPQRLGVDEQPVHVEQDRPAASGRSMRRSTWLRVDAISASVDCSGTQLELLGQRHPDPFRLEQPDHLGPVLQVRGRPGSRTSTGSRGSRP